MGLAGRQETEKVTAENNLLQDLQTLILATRQTFAATVNAGLTTLELASGQAGPGGSPPTRPGRIGCRGDCVGCPGKGWSTRTLHRNIEGMLFERRQPPSPRNCERSTGGQRRPRPSKPGGSGPAISASSKKAWVARTEDSQTSRSLGRSLGIAREMKCREREETPTGAHHAWGKAGTIAVSPAQTWWSRRDLNARPSA